jgi:geranylgeranylglycerol-phosphate geranylgeranyltransferase
MALNFRNILDLTNPEYALTIFTLISAFFLLQLNNSDFLWFLVPAFSYLFALFGFNSLNQVFDIEIDKISKPLRPIPSKRVSIEEAKKVSIFFFGLAFILALTSFELFLTILFFVLAILLYSHPKIFFRKFIWATPIFGMIFYVLIPFFCVTFFFQKELPIFFLVIFSGLTASISAVKDVEDLKSDKKENIASIPMKIGAKKTLFFAFLDFTFFSLLQYYLFCPVC